ncbi:MAG: hypothetical protein IKU30_00740 [Clostridia bacterium]|nr:hypothetical protein [Clostridia bacterium]
MSEEQINTGAENAAQENNNDPAPAERTFTQAEVDSIVARRLAKAQKGMPDEAELTAFRSWKSDQQTEQQRIATLLKERDAAQSDLSAALAKAEQLERERYLLSKGVSADDVDYIAFKAGKLVNDTTTFEQAAETVIKARTSQESKDSARVDLGAPLFGRAQTPQPNDAMNALIRRARNGK